MAGIKFDITGDNKNFLNSLKGAESGVDRTIGRIESAGRSMDNTFTQIKDSALGGFKEIAKGMAGLTALVEAGNFFKTMVDEAAQFHKAMVEVSTLSQDAADNLGEYKDRVVDLTTQIPVKATEAAKALYSINSAGHQGADGLKVLEESAKGAIGGVTDTESVADAITTILNSYKMEASEAQHVSDLLFTTVKLGKTTMGELGHSMAQMTPVAAAYGVSIEDALAAVASLTKQGTPTATAMMQVRDAITATTSSLGDAAFRGRSFLDALDEVAKKSQGSQNALKDDLSKLGAINAVLGLTGKNAKAARQDVNDIQNSAGAAEEAYQKMASTAGAQTELLRNNIFKFIQPVADEMKGMSGDIASMLNDAFDSGAIDTAVGSLEAFIAAYTVYKGLLISVSAYQKAAAGGMYATEIAELQQLVPLKELESETELQAAVIKGQLTTEQAKLIMALNAEAEARYEEITAASAAAKAELESATAAEASAQANMVAANEMVASAQARVASATESGVASEIEAAKTELSTASELQNTAAKELNTAQNHKQAASIVADVTAKNAETAATIRETVAEGANAGATGVLATAKLHLKRCIDMVNASFLASPLFWIAATIAAVTYAVYKLATAETAHEAAVRKANEAMDEQAQKIQDRKDKIDDLIRIIQDQNATQYQQVKAYDELKKIAPEITNVYSRQQLAAMEAADAQKMLNENMDETDYSTTKEEIDSLTKKLEQLRKDYEQSSWDDVDAGRTSQKTNRLKQQITDTEAQIEALKGKLSEIERIREEARLAAEEEAKPIEIRLQEAQQNEAEKQKVFDFYDEVMALTADWQAANETINYVTGETRLDAYIAKIQAEVDDLHTRVEENPLDMQLQMEEQQKTNVLNGILQWKADMIAGKQTLIPLQFQVDWNSAQVALTAAKNKAADLFNQTIGSGNVKSLADDLSSAAEAYRKAKQKMDDINANKGKYTTEEYNRAKSDLAQKKSTYEALGGDPDGRQAKAAAQNAKQLAQQQEQEQERKAREKYQQMLKKQQLQQKRDAEDMAFDTRQAEINALEEGTERTLKQIQLDFDKEKAEIERDYADLKQAKIDAARQLWEANPDNKGKSFDESTVNTEYTEAERRNYEALLKANEEAHRRSLEEQRKAQAQVMNDYLKEYGSIQDRRKAINDEYNQKIADADGVWTQAALQAERKRLLSELDIEALQSDIDWEVVFGNLARQSTTALRRLKDRLRAALDAKDITVENAQLLVDKIREIEDAITDKTDVWASILPGLRERKRLTAQAAAAEELYKKALKDEAQSINQVLDDKRAIQELLNGQDIRNALGEKITVELEAITEENKEALLAGIDKGSDVYRALLQLFENLAADTADATSSHEEVTKKGNTAKSLNDAVGNGDIKQFFKDLFNTEGMGFTEIANLINTNVQSMAGVVDQIGLGDTEFGEAVHDFADGVGGFNSAIQSLASGDIFGAVGGIISGLQGFGHLFGIGGGNAEEVNKTTERLTKANEELADRIEDLKDVIGSSAGNKAINAYEAALDAQKETNKNQMDILKAQMGYHSAHHSNNYYADDNYIRSQNAAAQKAFAAAGVNASTITGLDSIYNLTPDQLKAIKDFAPDLWQYLTTVGKYDKSEYWDAVVEQAGKTEELTEQINNNLTQTSFDSLRSSYLDALTDMESSSEDFAKSFEDMMFKAILNAIVLNDAFDEWLKDWQERYAQAVKNNDTKELERLRQEAVNKRDQKVAERDQLATTMGYDRTSDYEQEASKKAYEGMSQEVGQNLVGRATAIQIADESTANSMLTAVALLTAFSSSVTESNTILGEMRNLLIIGNSYLEDVAKYSKLMYKGFGEKIDILIDQTK